MLVNIDNFPTAGYDCTFDNFLINSNDNRLFPVICSPRATGKFWSVNRIWPNVLRPSKRSPIANQPQANENAPSESPTNERSSSTGLPGAHTGRLVWVLAALSFLFILNRNLRQGLAAPPDPFPDPVGHDDPDLLKVPNNMIT